MNTSKSDDISPGLAEEIARGRAALDKFVKQNFSGRKRRPIDDTFFRGSSDIQHGKDVGIMEELGFERAMPVKGASKPKS